MNIALYKIADTMMVPLTVTGKEISGEALMDFQGADPAMKLSFTVKAKKLFDYQQTGVLFHVRRNLYVLVAHNDAHGASSLFIIDAAKCEADGVGTKPEMLMGSKLNLRETVDQFGKAIVKAYARRAQGTWEPMKLN